MKYMVFQDPAGRRCDYFMASGDGPVLGPVVQIGNAEDWPLIGARLRKPRLSFAPHGVVSSMDLSQRADIVQYSTDEIGGYVRVEPP